MSKGKKRNSKSVKEHPFFGMTRRITKSVKQQMKALRAGREFKL